MNKLLILSSNHFPGCVFMCVSIHICEHRCTCHSAGGKVRGHPTSDVGCHFSPWLKKFLYSFTAAHATFSSSPASVESLTPSSISPQEHQSHYRCAPIPHSFTWLWRFRLRYLCSWGKYSPHWAITPAPTFFFFCYRQV